MRKSSLDQADSSLDRDSLWSDKEMDMIWHYDKAMEFVTAFAAVMLQCIQKQLAVRFDLEEPAALVGCTGHEVHSMLL